MPVNLAGIDLNLLTSLDAVLEERSVTRAAKRLGVSQPAVSHSLRRLRELLGDALLVRTRTGLQPTPRALELRPLVRTALEAAQAVLQTAPAFDPAVATRTFVISMADQASFLLLPTLVERLARDAPGIHLDIRPAVVDAMIDEVDLMIGVFGETPVGVRDEPLWSEQFSCVLRRGSAATRGPFDLARYVALSHLLVSPRSTPGSPLDSALTRLGKQRRVTVRVPHFLVAPHIVATTDVVWTAPASLARAFAAQLPLVLREPPLRIAGFTVAMRWHLRLDRDPGLEWVRGVLREIAPR